MKCKDFNELLGDIYNGNVESVVNSLGGFIGVDQYRDDWGSHFEIALPGVKKEELSVKLENRKKILINVNKANDKKDVTYIKKTVFYNNSFTIDVDPKIFDVKALKVKLESGMLYIAIPFNEEEKPSMVDINID